MTFMELRFSSDMEGLWLPVSLRKLLELMGAVDEGTILWDMIDGGIRLLLVVVKFSSRWDCALPSGGTLQFGLDSAGFVVKVGRASLRVSCLRYGYEEAVIDTRV